MSDTGAPRRTTKAEARQAFRVAIGNGSTVAEASRIAGVNRNTGARWKRAIMGELEIASDRSAIAAKSEVASVLSRALRDSPPAYVAQTATALSKVMGYEAPTRSMVEVRQIPVSVSSWLETLDAIDVTPEPPALVSGESHGETKLIRE